MALLYYWQPDNYRRDASFGFGYHLNQNSPAMSTAVAGASVWAFTRRRRDGLYALAAELVVRATTRNPPNYRYGAFRVWGDLQLTRYFDIDLSSNVEPLIRQLGVRVGAQRLGQSFQGHAAVRPISALDHQILADFSRELPVLERVHIYPEDEFEARLLHGPDARKSIVSETRAQMTKRQAYLFESVNILRAQKNVAELQELYDGRCQICLFHPRERYRHRLCHGHHIEWLSRGGEDELYNMALVCPNHHAAIHRDDATFDYATLEFSYSNGLVERLQLNKHLPAA
jgi:5-methylcytosine-specific restriction enzyme A